jgi:hypothetical protein
MFGYFKMFHAIFHNKHSFGSRSTVCQQADEVLSNPAKRICIQKCQKKAEQNWWSCMDPVICSPKNLNMELKNLKNSL